MKAQPIPVGPWPGGVNLLDSKGTVEPNELTRCYNYRLNLKGFPYKRPGFSKLGSSPAKVNSDAIHNLLTRYYNASGTKELLSIVNQKMYKLNDSTGAATQIDVYNRANPGATVNLGTSILDHSFTYKDRIYILDGIQPIRYNGSNATYAGHYEHAAPTIGKTAAGTALLAGTYKYRIASVAGNMGEGKATGEVSITIAAGDRIDLSAIDVAPARHEPTAKRIYRTKLNGSVFFYLTELASATTTYTDTTVDASLGSELILVHPPRATARFAVLGPDDRTYWFGMSGADASLVEPSDPGFPDRIYDSEFQAIANNDGDELTGGVRVSSGILFFKRNSSYLLRGFGTSPVFLGKIGCSSPKSIVEVPGGVVFLSTRGEIYFFDGVNHNEIGKKVKPQFVGLGSAGHSRVYACYHDFRYIIAYDYRGNKGYNSRVLEYDLIMGKWDGPHYNEDHLTPGIFCVYDSKVDNNELLWSEAKAAKGSYIYIRNDYAYLDDSTHKFQSILTTGLNNMGLNEKRFTKGFIRGRFTGDTKLTLSIILDNEVTKIQCNPINSTGEGYSLFDYSVYDTAVFSDIFTQVGGDPLDTSARAQSPSIEIDDGGSSIYHEIEEVSLLGNGNPLI